ncbi:MAG TPA: AMP-binding protein [Burkholderiales bacterium]|nr:AMP-binding protein [Burkholderiales bacterium]
MTASLAFAGDETAGVELQQRAARAASGFERLGIAEGDVVALMLRNSPAFIEAMLACRMLGAYYCPINWHFKADEAGFILRDSGAKALAVHAEFLPQIETGLPPGVPIVTAEPGWSEWRDAHAPWRGAPRTPRGNMPYTSGTTGRPKGVRRMPATDKERALALDIYRTLLGLEPGMRAFVSAPLYHSAPNLYAVQATLAGELVVIEPRFDAEQTLELIERHRITNAYLVPTMFVRLLRLPAEVRRQYDLSTLRFISSTGSPCAPEVKRAMIEWLGPIVTETYAASETGHITFIDSRTWLERPGSVGRPLGRGVVKILDEAGRELPPGEVGLIYCRQPAYPDFTYTNDPAARAAIERDGLWSVGDMGYLDADGYLYVSDRKSDMVISGGVNIYPAEIEATLLTMPAVADCAVFGIPDTEFGEALAAAIHLREGQHATAEQVQDFLRSRIANYKVPRVVTFHDTLPREESGKIFKRLLREPYWAAAGRRI